MGYYIGVDIGTSSIKVVAFSLNGATIGNASQDYDIQHPQPNWSEQNPDSIFEAIINFVNKVITARATDHPVFISFSAAMHSLILMDEEGKPLTNCIIWADNRASAIADNLRATDLGKSIYNATGVPIHAMSPLCKLLWFKQNEPELFKKAYKFIGIKEYIFFKLFGTYIVDTSIASTTGLLNLQDLQWDEAALNFLGINSAKLSQVAAPEYVVTYDPANTASSPLQLTRKTAFVLGGSDGALANLGTGAANDSAMVITIGTSGAARVIVETPQIDAQMRTFCYHVKGSSYLLGGASNNGAVVMQWLKETLLEDEEGFDEFLKQAAAITPGCDGLLFIPYILGERSPVWNSNTKGVYFGLTVNHTKAHLIRATLEGIVYNMYSIGKVLLDKRNIKKIYVTGGFTRSSFWIQLVADVFNIPVLVSNAVDSSVLGAVMIGAEALNMGWENNTAILATYQPDPVKHKVYMDGFERFTSVYELLKPAFKA